MGFTTKRQQIATALTGVPGMTGHPHRPSAPNAGDGWPVLGPINRAVGEAFNVTWRVRIVLPQDEVAASTWIDDHWEPLFYALEPIGFVGQAVPTLLATTGGELYALEITLLAEE
jgi:hypothetical protein